MNNAEASGSLPEAAGGGKGQPSPIAHPKAINARRPLVDELGYAPPPDEIADLIDAHLSCGLILGQDREHMSEISA